MQLLKLGKVDEKVCNTVLASETFFESFDEENPLRGDAAYALAMAHSTETSEEAESKFRKSHSPVFIYCTCSF